MKKKMNKNFYEEKKISQSPNIKDIVLNDKKNSKTLQKKLLL